MEREMDSMRMMKKKKKKKKNSISFELIHHSLKYYLTILEKRLIIIDRNRKGKQKLMEKWKS